MSSDSAQDGVIAGCRKPRINEDTHAKLAAMAGSEKAGADGHILRLQSAPSKSFEQTHLPSLLQWPFPEQLFGHPCTSRVLQHSVTSNTNSLISKYSEGWEGMVSGGRAENIFLAW